MFIHEFAIEQQDFELAAFLRDLKDAVQASLVKQPHSKPLNEIMREQGNYLILQRLHQRLIAAEQVSGVVSNPTTPPYLKPDDNPRFKELLDAVNLVNRCEISSMQVTDEDDDEDLDFAINHNPDHSEYMRTALDFESACHVLTRHVPKILQELSVLETALRIRTDERDTAQRRVATLAPNPTDQSIALRAYEDEIALWKGRALSCCFCDLPFNDLNGLKQHSAVCTKHPLHVG